MLSKLSSLFIYFKHIYLFILNILTSQCHFNLVKELRSADIIFISKEEKPIRKLNLKWTIPSYCFSFLMSFISLKNLAIYIYAFGPVFIHRAFNLYMCVFPGNQSYNLCSANTTSWVTVLMLFVAVCWCVWQCFRWPPDITNPIRMCLA